MYSFTALAELYAYFNTCFCLAKYYYIKCTDVRNIEFVFVFGRIVFIFRALVYKDSNTVVRIRILCACILISVRFFHFFSRSLSCLVFVFGYWQQPNRLLGTTLNQMHNEHNRPCKPDEMWCFRNWILQSKLRRWQGCFCMSCRLERRTQL